MTAAYLSPTLTLKSWTNNGIPNVNGTLTTYAAGTTTPIATYTDWTAGTPNANPLTFNARGEANVYLLPNVGYKLVEADSAGNIFKTTDQVFNTQLITLYGGVDSGIANAYVINFVSNFTSYTDGIVIIWIPSHSNTGASTININGLGPINIVNGDGSTFQAGEIAANIPAQILIKGGQAILLNPFTLNSFGTFTFTWQGFSVNPPSNVATYRRTGNLVTITMPSGLGTSNSTIMTITGIPSLLVPTTNFPYVPVVGMIDNTTSLPGGVMGFSTLPNTFNFYKDAATLNWTNSGSKGFISGFNPTFTYML